MEGTQVNNAVENQTQSTNQVVEENNTVNQVNQNTIQSEATSESNNETSNQEVTEISQDNKNANTSQPDASNEVPDNNIQEVEQKQPEINFSNDAQIASLQQQIAMISNIGQQEFLKLCNKYGVDFRPENIDKSAEELKQRDPNGYVDFNLQLNQLHNDVTARTNKLKSDITYYEVTNTLQPYKDLLNNSPVTNQVVNDILGQIQYVNPTQQVNYIMNSVMNIYKEAFEAGTLYGQTNKEQITNPGEVLNNSVMSNNPSVANDAPLKQFTREDISKMSLDEFKKNEKLIDDLIRKGLL